MSLLFYFKHAALVIDRITSFSEKCLEKEEKLRSESVFTKILADESLFKGREFTFLKQEDHPELNSDHAFCSLDCLTIDV